MHTAPSIGERSNHAVSDFGCIDVQWKGLKEFRAKMDNNLLIGYLVDPLYQVSPPEVCTLELKAYLDWDR